MISFAPPTTVAECDNMIRNCFYAGLHHILEQDRDQMIRNFFMNNPIASPVVMTAAQLGASTADCTQEIFEFIFHDNIFNHTDVTITKVPLPAAPRSPRQIVVGHYSIQLLKGIQYIYEPDSYEFSKARNRWGECTLVVTAYVGTEPVYFGDLTNMIP